ncbi:type I pullulanase [Paenibacillus lentus]|uniref:pullulanase n=1 Tax=Paenibacillus lentus TaxID=1338368 RepID=A0A3S8RQD9_9BACL|nr:type I pullulanase [Paenibacillus lentus]AZK45069.1 type I pullulanase [Paenibacillus lentus]
MANRKSVRLVTVFLVMLMVVNLMGIGQAFGKANSPSSSPSSFAVLQGEQNELHSPLFQEDGSVTVTGITEAGSLYVVGNFSASRWNSFVEMTKVSTYNENGTELSVYSYTIPKTDFIANKGVVEYKFSTAEGDWNASYADPRNMSKISVNSAIYSLSMRDAAGHPPRKEVSQGQSIDLKAVRILADGTVVDLTDNAEWSSSQPGVISVTGGKVKVADHAATGARAVISAVYENIATELELKVVDHILASPVIHDDGTVTFNNNTHTGNELYVIGSMNGWSLDKSEAMSMDAKGVFSATMLLSPGSYPYKFNASRLNWDESFADPLNPLQSEGNSVLHVPGIQIGLADTVGKGSSTELTATLVRTDGTTAEVSPQWSLKESDLTGVAISEGKLVIADDTIVKKFTIVAEHDGRSSEKEITVVSDLYTFNLHYYRYDDEQSDWNMWIWPEGQDGSSYPFTGVDADGFAVGVYTSASPKIGVLTRLSTPDNDWSAQEMDRKVEMPAGQTTTDVYLVENDPKVYFARPDTSPRFSAVMADSLDTLIAEASSEVADADLSTMELTDITDGNRKLSVNAVKISDRKLRITIANPQEFDVTHAYTVETANFAPTPVTMRKILDDPSFYYAGGDLGLTYTTVGSTFKLWAPTATKVSVSLYSSSGDYNENGLVTDHSGGTERVLSRAANGVWSGTVSGDLKGQFYMYKVEFADGTVNYAVDPYAVAVSANGQRTAIIDLRDTNPATWTPENKPTLIQPTDAVLYELHIRDFSISPDSGMSHKGKYKAFTEKGTTTSQGLPTGIDHLKSLGVTHVHLLPAYDFKTVNELAVDDPASVAPKYNWGYDPQNYNVPEGAYSSNPSDPAARIREFKEMVQSLHDEGIGVVMDVVYNHTFSIEDGPFNRIVPGYYYRTTDAGTYSNATGVGNEIASERPMVRKYIRDSVKYWAQEYGVDGFRFDLMGLIDIETMTEVTNELHQEVAPELIVYGEPWDMGPTPLPQNLKTIKGMQQNKGFAVFNDDFRGAIKGDSDGAGKGFATGEPGQEAAIVTGIKGATDSFAVMPSEAVNYVIAHDNLNLWDKIVRTQGLDADLGMLNIRDGVLESGGSIENAVAAAQPYKYVGAGNDVLDNETVRRSLLANGIVLTSQGIPFLHAGDEFLRTKYGDHNSYRSPDAINQIRWENKDKFKPVFDYYQGLIELRQSHPAFRMNSKEAIANHLQVLKSDGNIVSFQLKNYANGDTWNNIVVIYNANQTAQTVALPGGSAWNIVVNDRAAGTTKLGAPVTGSVQVAGLSMMVLYDEETVYTPEVSKIDLTPDTIGLEPGMIRSMTAVVRDQKGNPMTGASIEWSTSDSTVATVSERGLIRAESAGTATITATVGHVQASSTVQVGTLHPTKLALTGASEVYATQSTFISATLQDQFGQPLKGKALAWSSSDPSIATVSATGEVKGIKPGTVTITAQIGELKAEKQLKVLGFVKKMVQLRYTRPDQNYEDWNLWIWGTGGVSDGQVDFTVRDGVAIANIETAPDSSSVGFVVRKGTDWSTAKQDIPDDRNIPIGTGQTFVKVNVQSMVMEMDILPEVNGPELNEGHIIFYYRDDRLFRQDAMSNISGVKLNVSSGQDEHSYEMIYDAKNEYFVYTLKNVEPGKYYYDFTVTHNDRDSVVLDEKNPQREGNRSVVEFLKPELHIQGEVSPASLNGTIAYHENAVLALRVSGDEGVKLREAYADLRELGGGAKEVIDPQLLERTISVADHVTAGVKTIGLTVIDEYGNKHHGTVKITVQARTGNSPLDFDWDEARIYFLLTDRFYNGDSSNDNPNHIPGSFNPDQPEAYHGGDIRGIIEKLDYLDELGINTIWITPIVDNIDFDVRYGKSGPQFGYHGYWAKNFEIMDEHLGDIDDFKELIDKAHDRGIKIMVDVVLNHAGYGLKQADQSAGVPGYPTAVDQERFAGMLRDGGTDTVHGELAGLPDFKTEEAAVRDKLIEWQVGWLNKARTDRGDTIDYFRVDTVKHVDETTWMAFKNELTKVKPDFKLIGEYFGASPGNTGGFLGNGQMDSLLDFQFKDKAKDFVNGQIDSVESYLQQRNAMLTSDKTFGQFLSSHDESGFLSHYVDGDVGKLKVAAALQMTSKGQPVVYYGEELGQSGSTAGDMDLGEFNENRNDMPWDKVDGRDAEAMDIHGHYTKLLQIRAKHSKVFSKGTRAKLSGSDESGYVVFSRTYGDEAVIVGLNTKSEASTAEFAVPYEAGTILTEEYSQSKYTVADSGKVFVTIPGKDQGGTVVLSASKQEKPPKPGNGDSGSSSSSSSSRSGSDGSGGGDSAAIPADVQFVNDLTPQSGVIPVMAEPGKSKLVLPANAAAMDGTNGLSLKTEPFTLDVPASVVRQLIGLISGDSSLNSASSNRTLKGASSRILDGAQIVFSFQPLADEEGQRLLKLAEQHERATLISQGKVFDLALYVVTKDGTTLMLDRYAAPLHIQFNANAASDDSMAGVRGVLGIYRFNDAGSLSYAGARWSEAGVSARLSALGKLALAGYDKMFSDVPGGYWASEAIQQLAARQITAGGSEDVFAPASSVTRAEFTAMLVRVLNLEHKLDPSMLDPSDSMAYTDVPSSAWYAEAIAAANAAGIVKGRANGTFGSTDGITREEMAVMLMRAYAVMNGARSANSTGDMPFKDSHSIAPWARQAVSEAAALGILRGTGSDLFEPKDQLSRAESAQVIWKLLQQRQ